MISPGQTLHIKYTGQKLVCTHVIMPNKRNGNTQPVYHFQDLPHAIKHEQIEAACKVGNLRWEILD